MPGNLQESGMINTQLRKKCSVSVIKLDIMATMLVYLSI